jgi:transcriptional regulator with XRE-family HTH domain
MTPSDVKALRARLGCTTKELARALAVEPTAIADWESGEAFPTKKFVEAMARLDAAGPAGVPKLQGKKARARDPWSALADPETWTLFRKILAHPALRQAVAKLAEPYDDPTPT